MRFPNKIRSYEAYLHVDTPLTCHILHAETTQLRNQIASENKTGAEKCFDCVVEFLTALSGA